MACLVVFALSDTDSAPGQRRTLWAGVGLVLFGAYGMVAGWTLTVEESEALAAAAGGRLPGRPRLRADGVEGAGCPDRRGGSSAIGRGPAGASRHRLVDGVSGEVVEFFAEDNPEDWSDLDGSLTA